MDGLSRTTTTMEERHRLDQDGSEKHGEFRPTNINTTAVVLTTFLPRFRTPIQEPVADDYATLCQPHAASSTNDFVSTQMTEAGYDRVR